MRKGFHHVTEVLGLLDRGYGKVPREVLAEAARIGTETHRWITAWIRSGGNMLPPPGDVAPYVEKVKEWWAMAVEEVLVVNGTPMVEHRMYDTRMRLTGKLDAVVRLRGDRGWTIVDWKRVADLDDRLAGLQLCQYRRMFRRPVRRELALQIPKDGPCRAVEPSVSYEVRLAVFASLFNVFRYLKGGK